MVIEMTFHEQREREVNIRFYEKAYRSMISDDVTVLRWKSNDRIPPDEVLRTWVEVGFITFLEAADSMEQRQRETAAFLDEYVRNQTAPTDEELFEMRAAFGEGETVVNVLTGRTIQL